jgi:hypothetical protein
MIILIITDNNHDTNNNTIIMIDGLTQRLAVKKYISSPNTYGQGSLIPR